MNENSIAFFLKNICEFNTNLLLTLLGIGTRVAKNTPIETLLDSICTVSLSNLDRFIAEASKPVYSSEARLSDGVCEAAIPVECHFQSTKLRELRRLRMIERYNKIITGHFMQG